MGISVNLPESEDAESYINEPSIKEKRKIWLRDSNERLKNTPFKIYKKWKYRLYSVWFYVTIVLLIVLGIVLLLVYLRLRPKIPELVSLIKNNWSSITAFFK